MEANYLKSGLPSGVKLWLIIIFGTLGGIILLILIMRTCRIYCSADGQQESFQDIYHPFYTSAPGKTEGLKALESSMKGTPYSTGETLIGSRSPTWEAKAGLGGPMMAITKTEMAMVANEPLPLPGFKRLGAFNVFTKASGSAVNFSPPSSSLQGLGIIEPNYRVVHLDTGSEAKPNDEADSDSRFGSEDSDRPVINNKVNPASSSEGQRSSWNTTSSSSLFYSDTQGDGSDIGSSSRSAGGSRWLETPSGSTPRRRKDFAPSPRLQAQDPSSPSTASGEDIDVGTIRMVANAGTTPSLAFSLSDEDVKACSESIGAIKTASYRRITSDYSTSGIVSSEAGSASHRPKLIPFQGTQLSKHQNPLSPSASDDYSGTVNPENKLNPSSPDNFRVLVQNSNGQPDSKRRERISIQSDPYKFEPSTSKPGSPATSAIFFSSSEETGLQSSHPKHIFPSKAQLNSQSSSIRAPSPLYVSHTSESFSINPTTGEEISGRRTIGDLAVFTIGVGEPFHMTPSMKPQTSRQVNRYNPQLSFNSNNYYCALTDYPDQPALDRKQLPEWLHFDARECEIWGIPRKIDAGTISIQIIERKPFTRSLKATLDVSKTLGAPGPGCQREEEEVVARFTLEVVDKSPSKNSGHGDVATVTF